MSIEKLSTSRELASILGIAQITVQRLAARGDLPGRKVAGRWRFNLKEVETHLSQKVNEEDTYSDEMKSFLESLKSIHAEIEQVRDEIRNMHRGRR
jgi:excisionase family DNA binding protein